MSLRSRPRDVVEVQKFTARQDSMGYDDYVKDGDPVEVRCNVYPLTATESEALGLVTSESRAVHIHRGPWPADQHSELSHEGSLWEQVGPAVPYKKGSGTRHIRVIIRWLGAKP